MSVTDINKALDGLAAAERMEVAAHLNALLFNWMDDDWDQQMIANDAPLRAMREKSEAAFKSGRATPLEEGLDKP
ncbi:MAG: hypothetical protein SFY92_00655 [Verrucomicrobiae bacterium]|nr:hypothetical protein [Verrucomicrobiae bacterium]